MLQKSEDHVKAINDIQTSKDGYMVLVASKDTTAKVDYISVMVYSSD